MPGQPFTRSRTFPIFPRRFTLENRQSATGIAAFVIQQTRKLLTYALNSLCVTMPRAAIENHFVLVQKLWTMILPCGRLRKSVEESRKKTTACTT